MKKIFIYSLFLLVIVFLPLSIVSADIIPPNTYQVQRCVKIVNLAEFPDIYIIGYIISPLTNESELYIYKEDKCLRTDYKANQLRILAAKKSYIDSIGGVNNLQVKKTPISGECLGGCYLIEVLNNSDSVFLSDETIYPHGEYYIDQKNPLIKEIIEYSIAEYYNGKLILYKSKQISEYNDGTPPKIETFSNPSVNKKSNKIISRVTFSSKIIDPSPNQIVTPEPSITSKPVKKGIWQLIFCFFMKLFGKDC